MSPVQSATSIRTIDPATTILDIRGNADSEFAQKLRNVAKRDVPFFILFYRWMYITLKEGSCHEQFRRCYESH
jgi:hypothetical protein